jgi:hypothetical protein
METIIDIAYKFLWNNKKDKVKRKTIIADYENGGLKMLDLKSFIIAQRVMWVKRLSKFKVASWKAYPEYILNTIIGIDTFKTQLDIKTNKHNISPFYWTIIKSWNILKEMDIENVEPSNIRRQWLWMNKHIKINKQEIKWKAWISKDIKLIHDIVDKQGNFLTLNALEEIYDFKCDFLKYNSLKDAIPKIWREKLKTENIQREAISSIENPWVIIKNKMMTTSNITNKTIYWELVNKIRISPITKDKWIKECNLEENTWEKIFEIAKIIRDTKIRAFQYKMLLNLTPCNLYLYKIGRHNTYICHNCTYTDNIVHYLYECRETRNFWLRLQQWWNRMENEHIIITKEYAMVGITNSEHNNDKLNACLQLARWYIYTEKLKLQKTCLYKFLCRLKYKIKQERIICENNNQMKTFQRLWQGIEDYID